MQQSTAISFTHKHIFFFTATCALLAVALCLQFTTDFGDKDWLLIATNGWLHGEKLYNDIFESNPPLIFWLYALPVALSFYLPLADYQCVVLMGLLPLTLAITLSLAWIKLHPEFTHNKERRLLFLALLVFVFIIYQEPAYFLDREHLFFVFTFPYMLRFLPSLAPAKPSRRLSLLTGILAGLGFCIKPHCVIVLVGINVFSALLTRSCKLWTGTENICVAVVICAYVASIQLLYPQYSATILPMALATYLAIGNKMGALVYASIIFLPVAIMFSDFRLRYNSPYRKDIYYLLVVTLCFTAYALANHSWGYVWKLPADSIPVIALFLFLEYTHLKNTFATQGQSVKPFVFGARSCIVSFVYLLFILALSDFLMLYANVIAPDYPLWKSLFTSEMAVIENNRPITSYGSLTYQFIPWAHMEKAAPTLKTRFCFLWMLPKFFMSDTVFMEKNLWIINYVQNAFSEDLHNNKPQVVVVDDLDQFANTGKYVDLIAFLSGSPSFVQEWQNYRYVGRIDQAANQKARVLHHGYLIYERKI